MSVFLIRSIKTLFKWEITFLIRWFSVSATYMILFIMATPCGELKVDSENIPSFLPGLGPKKQDSRKTKFSH